MSVFLGDPKQYRSMEGRDDEIYRLIAEDLEVQGWHKKSVLEIYGFLSTMMIGRDESVDDNRLMDWTYPFTKDSPK